MMTHFFLKQEQATQALAARLQKVCSPPMLVFLIGDLGVGKTTFVRAFLKAAGCTETVKSPTYTLIESYAIQGHVYHHFDLYRLEDPQALEALGVRDYFQKEAICFIEWPERAEAFLPEPDLIIRLAHAEKGRKATIEGEIVVP